MQEKGKFLEAIDQAAVKLGCLSDAIWDCPETKYQEYFAAQLLTDYLKLQGFSVTQPVAGIPTAFTARFGSGGPVIGLLAEYDALEGMSQLANTDKRSPVKPDAPGHGCGHNLLGVGVVAAALAIRDYLKAGKAGTVVVYGCPAEEGGSGKTFLARDGVFDELDAALSWHPGDTNHVVVDSNLANCQVAYHFKGKAAHAALCPELGQSALDAVELMNVGVQFLREHVPQECRIHYAITDTGGHSPNIVQARGDVLYMMRAPKLEQVQRLNRRVDEIARGAAMMTETRLEIEFIKACSNVLPNRVLGQLMQKNLEALGAADYDAEDFALANKIQAAIVAENPTGQPHASQLGETTVRARRPGDGGPSISTQVLPYALGEGCSMSSSDVGDVSWICPVAVVSVATMAAGTVMHSWQEVAVGKSSMAKKGMLQGAKVLAATAIDLYESPEILEQAKEEKNRRTGNLPYLCPIPAGVSAPIAWD